MGRPSEGWKISRPEGRKCFVVIFSHGGRQYKLGTGEEAEDAAARAAAIIYAETLTGKRSPRKRGPAGDCRPLGAVGADWLSSIAATIDRSTLTTYMGYVSAHFVPAFATLDRVTHGAVSNYIQSRLKCVKAPSVRKELGALRGLLSFALGIDRRAVVLPFVPSRAVGKAHKQGKRTRTPLTPAEALAIVIALPTTRVITVRGPDKKGLYSFRAPVRARVICAYETGLRPKALDLLSVPEHYTKGAATLRITREIDKARFAREIPLSPVARAQLDAVCPESGPIFGKFRNRKALRNAARSVGLAPDRVDSLHPYDLRAARLTHWAEGGNLPGVQWLAGHKKMSTTAIYAQGSLRSAEAVLAVQAVQELP